MDDMPRAYRLADAQAKAAPALAQAGSLWYLFIRSYWGSMTKLGPILTRKTRPRTRRGLPGRGRRKRRESRYFAFLSYSHCDRNMADWLYGALESFRVPASLVGRATDHGAVPRRLIPIFRDEQELAAATDLGGEIREALANSQYLVVLCSPDAARSRWVEAEVATFKRSRPDGCVLAVIAAGEPFASEIEGREAEECFPPSLRQKFDSRGRPTGRKAEPIAADLRGEANERRLGLLKLIAGMIGVGLDDLVQRDTVRRQKRMAWLAAVSLSGMAIASMLAIAAIQARDAARDQRREAEGLVAFMLGDLKDKLEPIGKLDALDGVGAKVLEYYRKQDATELPDSALLQRSQALSLSAQVAYQRGNFDSARKLYQEALDGTGEAVKRAPGDPQRLYDHVQNIFWLGELARRRGDIETAERSFRDYINLANRMAAIEPDNLRWRMEVQYARENLGIVMLSQRRFAEAARQFANAMGPVRSLASMNPDNSEYQSEYTNVLAWLADARRAEGKLDEAIGLRLQQIAALDRFVAGGNKSVAFRERITTAHQALGLLLAWRGDSAGAIAQFKKGVIHANQLIALEPENSVWTDQAANVELALSNELLKTGRDKEARTTAEAGCAKVRQLRIKGSGVARWRKLETDCRMAEARIAGADGDAARAISIARQATVLAQYENSGDPIEDRYRLASSYLLLGDLYRQVGNMADARRRWSTAFATLPKNVAERPMEMEERAQLLYRLGRGGEGAPIRARLSAIGYRSSMGKLGGSNVRDRFRSIQHESRSRGPENRSGQSRLSAGRDAQRSP